MIVIVVLFGAALSLYGDSENSTYTLVSAEVEAYAPVIRTYTSEHGIPEYVELIKAVMMQESGGRGTDPMQASESGYNTRYPNTPNGITDPEYSINIGVKTLAMSLNEADVKNPIVIWNIPNSLCKVTITEMVIYPGQRQIMVVTLLQMRWNFLI